jgi:hypothetical protein
MTLPRLGYVRFIPNTFHFIIHQSSYGAMLYSAATHKKLSDFSPQANYTDRATAACRRSLVPTFADRWCRVVSATNPHGR